MKTKTPGTEKTHRSENMWTPVFGLIENRHQKLGGAFPQCWPKEQYTSENKPKVIRWVSAGIKFEKTE